jgi:hypothetical protein
MAVPRGLIPLIVSKQLDDSKVRLNQPPSGCGVNENFSIT